jgi:hypothetical protein
VTVHTRKTMPHLLARHTCVCIYPHIYTPSRARSHTTHQAHTRTHAHAHAHTHTHTLCVYCTRTVTREHTHAPSCTHNRELWLRTHMHAYMHPTHSIENPFCIEHILQRTHTTETRTPYVSTPFWSCRLVDQRSCQREQSPATFLRLRVFGARCSWSDSTSAPAP